jgi:hypothetical protein
MYATILEKSGKRKWKSKKFDITRFFRPPALQKLSSAILQTVTLASKKKLPKKTWEKKTW